MTATTAFAGAGPDPQITRHQVTVGGGQIHFVTDGEGDVVLLLHQAPLSHAESLETIPLLAQHVRVVAWDAPGHGSSSVAEKIAIGVLLAGLVVIFLSLLLTIFLPSHSAGTAPGSPT